MCATSIAFLASSTSSNMSGPGGLTYKNTLWTKLIFQPEPGFKVWDGAVSVGGREGWAASKDRVPARWTSSTTSETILEHKKYITWTNLGERKGQENLKNDLVRRIKMLEYALKQVFPVDPTNQHGTDGVLLRSELNIPNWNMVERGVM